MPTTITEFHQLYQSLQQGQGRQRRAACQAFCEALIGAQRRGELGIVPAAALIEEALQAAELPADEILTRLRMQVALLQEKRGYGDHDPVAAWREFTKGVEELPW
jgi:hypothetical protein